LRCIAINGPLYDIIALEPKLAVQLSALFDVVTENGNKKKKKNKIPATPLYLLV